MEDKRERVGEQLNFKILKISNYKKEFLTLSI